MFRRRSRKAIPADVDAVEWMRGPELVGVAEGDSIEEFHSPSGEWVLSLHDFWCIDISYRPRECELVLTFEPPDDDEPGPDDPSEELLTLVMTFEQVRLLHWEDEGDGPKPMPSDWPSGVRGQVNAWGLNSDGTIGLDLMNVGLVFSATRATYEFR